MNGYIERKTVAEIYHHSNYSTFDFIKEESEYKLWEGKQQTRCIIIMRIIVGESPTQTSLPILWDLDLFASLPL